MAGIEAVDPQQLGLEFGSSAVIGGVIGFAAKKVAKVIAVLVGIQLALFKFLESRGLISVKWDELTAGAMEASTAAAAEAPPSWVMSVLSTLSVSTGFSGGFLLGFKKA
jgi:uncharacterized membrane protein (Fun14 family)